MAKKKTAVTFEEALAKLEKKRLDLIVANQVDAADSGFGLDTTRASIIVRGKEVNELLALLVIQKGSFGPLEYGRERPAVTAHVRFKLLKYPQFRLLLFHCGRLNMIGPIR